MRRFLGNMRWTLRLSLAAAAAISAAVVWQNRRRPEPTAPDRPFPLPALTPTAFLNTGNEARYVGIDTCKGCHAANHRSYLLTAHSRALSDLDPEAEPPDGTFEHKPSGRSYRIYRQGKQLRHEELLRDEAGQEVARLDLPIRYLIGSGHFTRSYLVEVDGFLQESPITWYTSRKAWGLSPGYDFDRHWSFERPITIGCLSCHAGRVEPEGQAIHRMKIHEQAIGCESCHGPGSFHTEFHRAKKQLVGESDPTIVNPGKLSRSALESVCAVCHLSGVVSTYLRGRRVTDYRPGMPLSDYRIDYRFDAGSEQMTVVGHSEQLRKSACYQKSKDLTCLTCHALHAKERPKDLVAYHRDRCLSCHTTRACKEDLALRHAKADSCVACHMPRGDTEIPHIAFTHHRIGRHAPQAPSDMEGVPELVPIADAPHLSDLDRKRNLGLAYIGALNLHTTTPAQARTFRVRARELLETVDRAKMRDEATTAALATLSWDAGNPRAAADYAERTLAAGRLPAAARADALLVLANGYVRARLYGLAIDALEKLTRMRRYSGDWRLLGLCYLEQGEMPKAIEALNTALAIRPWRHDVHLALAQAHSRLGDLARAQEHHARAQWLARNGQR
jgi:hypothetical protein